MTDAALIPLEVLLGQPDRTAPRLSPDGTRLSYLAPRDGVLNVFVTDLGTGRTRPVTHDTERGINAYLWTHDDRRIVFLKDRDGSENHRLYDVDLVTGVERDLTPFEGVQCQIIAHRKEFPNDLLVAINEDDPRLHDVHHLDLTTGELRRVVENPGVVGWVVDAELAVRGAVARTADGGSTILVRDDAASDWRPLLRAPLEDAETTKPVGFTRDGAGLYLLTSVDSNTSRLVEIDVATGTVESIAEDPDYDVTDVIVHPDTRAVQGAIVYGDRVQHLVLDEAIRGDVEALQRLAAGDLTLVDRSADDRIWLVAFDDDRGPVQYHRWDRTQRSATFLFDHRPELNDQPLAPMEPFAFTTRDGLTVHGYLTFPSGVERALLPTVLVVHGGPWGRCGWGFDPEAQWLANRGYLCMQVNFRGSTGYGKDFLNAGNREWGAKMHDDLLDAIDHLVARGVVDRDRIAIYGASYGGYAALIGATFTPDVFTCAISAVGPSNLVTLIESVPDYWKPLSGLWHQRIGEDREFLWSRSPLSRVDAIEIPVLIAQGANDPRVTRVEAEQIVAAMTERGIDHEYVLYPDEGHGFVKPGNRLDFYRRADRFLAKHLGGRSE